MRLIVIEKHVALRWIDKGVEIPNFEAPGYVAPASSRTLSKPSFDSPPTTSSIEYGSEELNVGGGEKEEKVTRGRARRDHKASPWPALLHMVTAPRPVTLFILSGFQGFVIGGVLGKLLLRSHNLHSVFLPMVFFSQILEWFCGFKNVTDLMLSEQVSSSSELLFHLSSYVCCISSTFPRLADTALSCTGGSLCRMGSRSIWSQRYHHCWTNLGYPRFPPSDHRWSSALVHFLPRHGWYVTRSFT